MDVIFEKGQVLFQKGAVVNVILRLATFRPSVLSSCERALHVP